MQFNGQIVTEDPNFTGGTTTGHSSVESVLHDLEIRSRVSKVVGYIVTGSDGSIRVYNTALKCVEHTNAKTTIKRDKA